MRNTCRWLGCAALLCFTAVEFSGCSSKPLISGMKWPRSQVRDSAFALKDKQLTAEESEDLLAQAREFEQDEDYPQAARTYREYLNGGGLPMPPSQRASAQQVGKSKPQSAAKKISAKESEELLAQAREYEKSGDFPKAAHAYREYLNGGELINSKSRATSRPVAQSEQPASNQPDSLGEDRDNESRPITKPAARPTAQSEPLVRKPGSVKRKSETTEDPWANELAESDHSNALPIITPSPNTNRTRKQVTTGADKQPRRNESSEPSKNHAWAQEDATNHSDESISELPPHAPHRGRNGLSQEALDDLLDLDEGEIDWGDEPGARENIPPDDATVLANETLDTDRSSDLPLVDLNSSDLDPLAEAAPPVMANDKPEAGDAADEDWHSHAQPPEPSGEETVTETDLPETTTEDEFAPPILSEQESEQSASLALLCKDCEPWVYAQALKLESPQADVRKEGLTHLAEMGSKARQAGLAVRTLLQDVDPLVQAHAAWALWEIENDPWDSVGTLRPLLDHSNPDVVQLACYLLGDIGAQAEGGTDALELLRDHADGTTRIHAAEALIRIRGDDEKSIAVLAGALKSRDSEERWIAAVALGRCRGEHSAAAVTALTAALQDVDPEVRSTAALSLGGLGKSAARAAPELERVARSDDAQVRDAARAALACLKQ